MTQARLRPLAEADLIDKTAHYRSAGGNKLAERFFDSALASLRSIERMPGIGSPLVGEMCDTSCSPLRSSQRIPDSLVLPHR